MELFNVLLAQTIRMYNKYNARLIQRIHFSDLKNKAYNSNYQHITQIYPSYESGFS